MSLWEPNSGHSEWGSQLLSCSSNWCGLLLGSGSPLELGPRAHKQEGTVDYSGEGQSSSGVELNLGSVAVLWAGR